MLLQPLKSNHTESRSPSKASSKKEKKRTSSVSHENKGDKRKEKENVLVQVDTILSATLGALKGQFG